MEDATWRNLGDMSTLKKTMAEIMMENGYSCTLSVEKCRTVLTQCGAKEVNPAAVARTLGMMVRTPVRLGDHGQQHSSNRPEVPGVSTWNMDIFLEIIKEMNPHLNWRDVVSNLDHKEFIIPSRKGLKLLVHMISKVHQPFPADLVYKPWNNTEGQLSFLKQALKHPDVFCLADHMADSLMVVTDILKSAPNEDDREIATWKCLSLVETLVRLSDSGHYAPILELFNAPIAKCPDILVLALLQITQTWNQIKQLLLSSLMPIFLGQHANSAVILHYAWHHQGNVKNMRHLLLETMVHWYIQGEPHDQVRLSRILNVAQDLKVLQILLTVSHFDFTIDLACLASGLLRFDKWLNERINTHKEAFIQACVTFLKFRCPQLLGSPKKETLPLKLGQQLRPKTIEMMLNNLKKWIPHLGQELSDIITSMCSNAPGYINKVRSVMPRAMSAIGTKRPPYQPQSMVNATSPQDIGENCQVTSVNANKNCKSRESLTKLHLNATRHIGGNNQKTQEKRNVSGEHCDHVCNARQRETETVDGKHATEITHKSRKNTWDKKGDIAQQAMGYAGTVPSLDSGSLPVDSGSLPVDSGSFSVDYGSLPKNYDTLPVNSENFLMDSGSLSVDSVSLPVNFKSLPVDSGSLPVVKDETHVSSNLGCSVNEQESEGAKVDDCLCNSSHRKSQTSFLTRVNEAVKSLEYESASFQAEADSANESVLNQNESAYPAVVGTTAICDRNTCPNTTVSECKELESTCEDKNTHENITQCPPHSTRYSVQQGRSVREYSQSTPRTTTIELNAHSVNSSGKKYSDFSISFLLNQDSPSMIGTIRCNHRNVEQTTRRRHKSPCESAKRLALSEALCCNTSTKCHCDKVPAGCSHATTSTSCSCDNTPSIHSCDNTMTRCSCDQCSSNQVGTACRCEDNCHSRQTPDRLVDTGCSGKSKSRCSSAALFRNKQFALRPLYDRPNTSTTPPSLPQNEQKLNVP